MNNIEEKRNRLNLEIRELITIIDMIDGLKGLGIDYKENTLNEADYLDEQIKLVLDIKTRLINVFK